MSLRTCVMFQKEPVSFEPLPAYWWLLYVFVNLNMYATRLVCVCALEHVCYSPCAIWTCASLLMGLMNPVPFWKKVVFAIWEHNMPFLLSHWFSQLEIFHLIHVNRSCNLPLVLVIHTLKISLDLKVEKLEWLGQTWDTPLTLAFLLRGVKAPSATFCIL
jgi:hypothetical protein